MNPKTIRCANCQKPIRPTADAVALPQAKNQMLHHDCFHQQQSTVALHGKLYPSCHSDWHDMNDHLYLSGPAAKLAAIIARQSPKSQLEIVGRSAGTFFTGDELARTTFPRHLTARDLITEGECTAQCLLALNGQQTCACPCNDGYHGLMADMPLEGPFDNKDAV